MKDSFRNGAMLALGVMLASCGGGGPAVNSVTSTSTAVFRDSPITGLYYENSSRNGYTDSLGRFTYVPGQPLTFYIGLVKLGTFTPTESNATVSPASLVPAGTANRATVIGNLARFLLTADNDGNPANGITISTSLDNAAANWAQVNFAGNIDSDAAAQTALASMSTVNAAHPVSYVSSTLALNHLVASMNCAYTGAFAGTRMTGSSVDSRVAFIVDGNGAVSALQYFPQGTLSYAFHSGTAFDYGALPTDDSLKTTVQADGPLSSWLRYSQRLGSTDQVWINTTLTSASGFSGNDQAFSRLAGRPDAGRRFEAIVRLSDGNDYLLLLETAVSGTVLSGSLMNMHNGETAIASGNLSGSVVAATAVFSDRSVDLAGSISAATLPVWTGSLKQTLNSVQTTQAFSATGCTLN